MPETHPDPSIIEDQKLVHDYLKHLSTLSTGSLVLMVAFLEKIAKQPEWKLLVAVSFGSFTLSVITSVLAQTGNIELLGAEEHEFKGLPSWLCRVGLVGAWAGFSIGIISLGVFAVKNL